MIPSASTLVIGPLCASAVLAAPADASGEATSTPPPAMAAPAEPAAQSTGTPASEVPTGTPVSEVPTGTPVSEVPSAPGYAVSRAMAVGMALTMHPQVASARAVEAQSKARGEQADAAQFPTVTVTLGVGPSLKARLVSGTAVQSTENTYSDVGLDDLSITLGGQLEILQPLYTFGKIGHRAEAAAHELKARKAQTDMTRADVALEVAKLYETLLFAREVDVFLGETQHFLERSEETTKQEIASGTGPTEQDLLRLQSALGALQIFQHQAAAGQRQATAGLVAYLGLPVGTELALAEPGLDMLPGPSQALSGLIDEALAKRPELIALTEGSAAFQALSKAEAAGSLPDFFALAFAFGGYTPGRDVVQTRFVQDPLNGFYPGVLLGARWQFTGDMAEMRAEEQAAKAAELDGLLHWAKAGLPAAVTKAYEDAQRAQLDVTSATDAIAAAKKWLVQASADYSIGLGDARSVTDAAQAYLQLRVGFFDAKLRHNVAMAELAHATGTLVSPESPYYPVKRE